MHGQAVADHALEAELSGHRVGEMMETAGDKHRPAAVRLESADQGSRPRRRHDSLGEALRDGAFLQVGEQPHPLPQGAFEIEFALHRSLGDGGDLRLDPGIVGQFIDAFLADHRRVHIGDEHVGHAERFGGDDRVGRREALVDHPPQQGDIVAG